MREVSCERRERERERERERVRREERINTGILLFEKPQKRIRYYIYDLLEYHLSSIKYLNILKSTNLLK